MNQDRPPILIVEDDEQLREGLTLELQDRGFEAIGVSSMKEVENSQLAGIDLAVLDLRLERESGLKGLERIKEITPECKVILMTGYGSIATAVEAMKLGAHNYLTKPISVDDILDALFDENEPDDFETRLKDLEDKDAPSRTSLARNEKEYIEYVLLKCNGNITRAAEWLGIRRQSLQRKLKKYPPKQ